MGLCESLLLLGLLDRLFQFFVSDVLDSKFPHPVVGLLAILILRLQLKRHAACNDSFDISETLASCLQDDMVERG